MSHDEVRRLADECDAPYVTLILFLVYTGLRFGEMAALRVSDLDFARRRVHVGANLVEVSGRLHQDSPKSHRARSVPVPRFLLAALRRQVEGRRPDDLLFTTAADSPLRNSNFRHHVFDSAAKRAGLQPLTPHDLRTPPPALP